MDLKNFGAKRFAKILESAFKVGLARRVGAWLVARLVVRES